MVKRWKLWVKYIGKVGEKRKGCFDNSCIAFTKNEEYTIKQNEKSIKFLIMFSRSLVFVLFRLYIKHKISETIIFKNV